MATIKNTSNVLGNLINQVNAANNINTSNTYSGSTMNIDDDSIPDSMLNPEPVFEINYKSTAKQCLKKAKDQLKIIVKEVVPDMLQNSEMIQDKINQDAEQLGNLYNEYVRTDKIVQACMETIARGETQAKLFDVYSKLTKQQQDLSAKITETQNQMRKYYIDTYLDLQQKDNADDIALSSVEKPALPDTDNTNDGTVKMENVIMGTENTVKLLAEKKKQALIAKFQEVKE